MDFLRKVILICFAICFVEIVHAQNKPETPNITITAVCSTTPRTNATPQTYQTMYSPSVFQKLYFKDVDWNKIVAWAEVRYDNTRSIKDSCKESFRDDELGKRTSFWDKYFSVYKIFFPTNDLRSSSSFYAPSNIWKIQSYIKWACGLNIATDGKLWKKTVNSIRVCDTLPAWWKISRADFQTLAEAKALFVDSLWKIPIYNGTAFDVNFKPDDMYVDISNSTAISKWITTEAIATTKWLKIIKKEAVDISDVCKADLLKWIEKTIYDIMKTNLKIDTKCCYIWSTNTPFPVGRTVWWVQANYNWVNVSVPLCTQEDTKEIPPTTPSCRFAEPTDGAELKKYNEAKWKLWDVVVPSLDKCKDWCDDGYIEKKIWNSSVCQKCNPDTCNCGIKLNTNIPFIGRCIMNEKTNKTWQNGEKTTVNPLSAFPILMGALIKFLMSIIMIVCFSSLIIWWFMMTIPDEYDTGKWIVKKVMRTIVSLWLLWTILYLINPNFFF
jgi:hypothetical protein